MTRPKRKHRSRRRTLLPRILDFIGALDQRVTALEGGGTTAVAIGNRVAALEERSALYSEALKNYLPR